VVRQAMPTEQTEHCLDDAKLETHLRDDVRLCHAPEWLPHHRPVIMKSLFENNGQHVCGVMMRSGS
jgi:hypothetical protein